MTSLIILIGVVLAIWGAIRKDRRHIQYGIATTLIGFAAAVILAMQPTATSTMDASATAPRPSSRHGLSARRVESECLNRVSSQLVSPGSMRVIGNPVGADPIWDGTEDEWRWIVDVSGVNAFNVRIRGRFQCIVRAGPSWTVQQVN